MTDQPDTKPSSSLVIQLGQFTVHVVSGGRYKMDGGTMFGLVPKVLWSKRAQPDKQNFIEQATNCLLVDTGHQKVLVDTGYGGKLTEKERANVSAEEGSPLDVSLERIGVTPSEIDTVILSHLHFDHAGGSTHYDESGVLRPSFPNAEYVVQRREWMMATADLPELRGAYPRDNLLPLQSAECLRLVDGNTEIVSGIRALVTSGHTPAHQSVLMESGDDAAIFLGDLCPTSAHLPMRWGMSYDLDVLQTRRTKMEILGQIAGHGWWAFFVHDPETTHARLRRDDKRDFEVLPVKT